MMKTVAVLAIAVSMTIAGAVLLVARPAHAAESAEHPDWKVGDKWIFQSFENPGAKRTTWTREVMAARPDGGFDVATGAGETLTFDSDGNSLDKRGPEYSWRRFKFPMTVGASWSHEHKTGGSDWWGWVQANWRVVAYEKIRVPGELSTASKSRAKPFRTGKMLTANTRVTLAAGSIRPTGTARHQVGRQVGDRDYP
jgi:hypothetical protein